MKKYGFTLVELLGVIIILGVIALITFPIINNSIKNSKEKALEQTIDNIEKAAYEYSIKNDIGYQTYYKAISLETLASAGILVNSVINPVTDEQMQGCVLYKWVEEYKQYEFKYDEECDVPPAPPNFINTLLKQYKEGATTGLVKDSTNENLYYYKGTNEQVSNNFLWYGGHQWRVIEFDMSANTLTLITQQPLTAIDPTFEVWTDESIYDSSYIDTWLYEYFWNSLDSSIQNNILDNTFNIGISTDVDEITITKKVGLLDQTQYERAGSTNSFLDIKDWWWLGNRYNSSKVRYVDYNGSIGSNSVTNSYGVRAVIKISDITITGGDGTLVSNYQTENKATNTNNVQVGEYINVPYSGSDNTCGSDNICTFRVVSKDNDSIKVILNGLLSEKSSYGDSTTITTSSTIYNKLNLIANNILSKYRYTENKMFYIGNYPLDLKFGQNYNQIKDETLEASVGLPTVGEMFSGNDIDIGSTKIFVDVNTIENPSVADSYFTMNRYGPSSLGSLYIRGVVDLGSLNSISNTYSTGVRPVIYLKSNLTFTGGEGTAQSPYELE